MERTLLVLVIENILKGMYEKKNGVTQCKESIGFSAKTPGLESQLPHYMTLGKQFNLLGSFSLL
jgi:hypothetical protein